MTQQAELIADLDLTAQQVAMVAAQMILVTTHQAAARAIGIVNFLANESQEKSMEYYKGLTKIALAALILASATLVNGQVDSLEVRSIFLVADDAAYNHLSNDYNQFETPPSTGGVYENISYAYVPPPNNLEQRRQCYIV